MNALQADEIKELLTAKQNMDELVQLEQRVLGHVNTDAVVEAHRRQTDDLEVLNQAIEGISRVYDEQIHDREPLEDVYVTKIGTLFDMARRFHPLSEYGIEMMQQAVECRKDFEELAGDLISRITAKNVEAFADVLTADLMEEITVGKSFGLGALRSRGRDVYAAGAAVFYIDTVGTNDERVLRVKWLYVDEEWRERGVANCLVGELIHFMAEEGYAAMTVDFYTDDSTERLGDLFTEWHFRFTEGLTPEFAFSLSDIREKESLEKYSDKATPLAELKAQQEQILVREYMAKTGYSGYLAEQGLPEGFIEDELSCYVGSTSKPEGLTLAHEYPSGRIGVEYSRSRETDDTRLEEMLGAMALTASYKYDKSTEVVMNEDLIEDRALLDELFRRQRAQYMIEAILTPPGRSISSEEVTRLLQE